MAAALNQGCVASSPGACTHCCCCRQAEAAQLDGETGLRQLCRIWLQLDAHLRWLELMRRLLPPRLRLLLLMSSAVSSALCAMWAALSPWSTSSLSSSCSSDLTGALPSSAAGKLGMSKAKVSLAGMQGETEQPQQLLW